MFGFCTFAGAPIDICPLAWRVGAEDQRTAASDETARQVSWCQARDNYSFKPKNSAPDKLNRGTRYILH